jgi:hypothetical protein
MPFLYVSIHLVSLDIAHSVIDLLLQVAQNPSANTSPSTPSSPSPHPSPRNPPFSTHHSQFTSVPYKADQLIRLKIVMRETEHPPRPRQPLGSADPSAFYGGDEATLLGRNEGTVRFLFGPPGIDRRADYLTDHNRRHTNAGESWTTDAEVSATRAFTRSSDPSATRRRGRRAGRKIQAHRSDTATLRDSPPWYHPSRSTSTAVMPDMSRSRMGNPNTSSASFRPM